MYAPAIGDDIPDIVAVMNRAYRGNTGSGWSTEKAYLEGDRTTEAFLRDDLYESPRLYLLKRRDEPNKCICWLRVA